MSYILDALKRADSERERGLVPGLHAQPVPIETPAHGAMRAIKPLMLLMAGASLLVLCVVLWRWLGPEKVAPVAQSSVPAQAALVMTAPMASMAPMAGSVQPPAAPRPPDVMPAAPMAAPSAQSVAPEATRPPSPQGQAPRMVMAPAQITPDPSLPPQRGPDRQDTETRGRSMQRPVQSSPPAPPAPVYGATPQATLAPGGRVAPLAELPADIRLAMPKLVISGATYADNSALRMLIINGQVFHEGEKVATDLLLDQIGPKSAVMNFKGQRYMLTY